MGRFPILEVKDCRLALLWGGFWHDGIDMMVSDWKCHWITHSHLIELKLSTSLLLMCMKVPTKLNCKFHCSQKPTRSGMEQCRYLGACSINCPTIKKILALHSTIFSVNVNINYTVLERRSRAFRRYQTVWQSDIWLLSIGVMCGDM